MQRTTVNTGTRHGDWQTWCASALLLLTLWTGASTALAHPLVDEGMRLASELELEAAREVFDRALASHELERDEVVQVLIEKAFVLHALRDKDALVEAFAWLAAFEPDYVLGVRAPPDMVAVWTSVRDQARGRLDIRVEYEVAPGRLRAQPVLTGVQPPGLVTEFGLRGAGEDWELRVDTGAVTGAQASVERAYPEGIEIDLYARVEGLGTELAADGSVDTPIRVVVPPLHPAEAVPLASVGLTDDELRDDRRVRRRRLGWISAACALVVVGAVATTVALWPRDPGPTTITPMVPEPW